MVNERPVRFKLRDGLILIVGIAIGLAMVINLTRWRSSFGMGFGSITPISRTSELITLLRSVAINSGEALNFYFRFVLPVIAPISVAVLICRLTQLRPSRQRLSREPGFFAMVAVTFILMAWLPVVAIAIVSWWQPEPRTLHSCYSVEFIARTITCYCAYAVAVSWVLLAISNRWRAKRNWADRVGRLLGAVWILPAILAPLEQLR